MKTKIKKKTVISDVFEQIADTATGSLKQIPRAVGDSLNPLSNLPESHGVERDTGVKKQVEKLQDQSGNHTNLDLGALEKLYEAQDQQKEDVLRQRLFKLVKEGEEQVYEGKKKEEEEKKQREESEDRQKKITAEKKNKNTNEGTLPRGKVRRNIFSPKKKAQQQHIEYRPSAGQG